MKSVNNYFEIVGNFVEMGGDSLKIHKMRIACLNVHFIVYAHYNRNIGHPVRRFLRKIALNKC